MHQQHYQLQIASKTNQNSSTLDKKYGPKVAALRQRLNDSDFRHVEKQQHGQTLWKIALQNRVTRNTRGTICSYMR
jgi:hypothetical protein